tara:strand:+ start:830 stop:1210 length:381 start_codon:yes stop_codon:yes gene_type:complete
MAKLDSVVARKDAAGNELAKIKARMEEEDVGVMDVVGGVANLVDAGLAIAKLPPLASASVGLLEGAVEGDIGKATSSALEGAKTYAMHEAGKAKAAKDEELLGLRKQEVLQGGDIKEQLLKLLSGK